jgi:AcrR family transcriptional regulator
LYYHFETKADILVAIVNSFVDGMIGELSEVCETLSSPPVKLREFIRVMLMVVLTRRSRMTAFLRERRALPAWAWPDVHLKRDRIDDLLQGVLDEGKAAGYWREFPLNTARLAIFGIVSWSLEWLDPEGPKTVDELSDEFTDLILGGLAAPA